jgi:hypothetical protein
VPAPPSVRASETGPLDRAVLDELLGLHAVDGRATADLPAVSARAADTADLPVVPPTAPGPAGWTAPMAPVRTGPAFVVPRSPGPSRVRRADVERPADPAARPMTGGPRLLVDPGVAGVPTPPVPWFSVPPELPPAPPRPSRATETSPDLLWQPRVPALPSTPRLSRALRAGLAPAPSPSHERHSRPAAVDDSAVRARDAAPETGPDGLWEPTVPAPPSPWARRSAQMLDELYAALDAPADEAGPETGPEVARPSRWARRSAQMLDELYRSMAPETGPEPIRHVPALPQTVPRESGQVLDDLYASLWTEPAAPAGPEAPAPEPAPTSGRHRIRRRTVLGAGGLGCMVAGAVVLATTLRQAPPDVGALPATSAISSPVRMAATGVVPQRIAIPGRGVVAPVVPVVTGPDGSLAIPEQPTTVGWWSPGSLPGGSSGTAVLAGHVDTRLAGFGSFAVLHELAEGERIDVTGADGRTVSFTVAARREFAKAQLPVADLFGAAAGPPRLVLITCGGAFDPVARSYDDNVVVYAVPLPAGG